jgi:hypothetical protein
MTNIQTTSIGKIRLENGGLLDVKLSYERCEPKDAPVDKYQPHAYILAFA